MNPETILTVAELVFTIIGIVVVVGTAIVKITPGDRDDNWWNKWILKLVPAILPGDLANKVTGRGAINKVVLLGMIKRANDTYDKLKEKN